MENIEYIGQWWIPSDENNKIFGILKFTENDGFNLNLLGSFEQNYCDIIVGETNNNKISLFCCQKTFFSDTNATNTVTPSFTKSYFVKYAFIGKIYEDKLEYLKFNKFKISYTFLTEWFNDASLSSIKFTNNVINFSPPSHSSINWGDYKITLKQDFKTPINRSDNIELRLVFTDYFEIETSGKTIYEIQEDIVKPLKHFVEIGTNQHNLITYFAIITDDNQVVKIMGDQGLIKSKNYHYKPLICFDCHKNKISQMIISWLNLEKEIAWLIDLYCSAKYYTQDLSDTAKFMFMWQCLEGFYKNIEISDEKKENIKDITSEELIKYFLNKDQKFILYDLLSFTYKKDALKCIIKKYFTKLTDKIVATRNLHTHYFDENKSILKYEQIFRISYLLSFLFLHSLLTKLKFEKQEIQFMFSSQLEWLYLKEIFPKLNLLN